MARQTVITKKRRGPAPTGKGTLVGVRLQPANLEALDAWIAQKQWLKKPCLQIQTPSGLSTKCGQLTGAVAELVGIEVGVVSGVMNLESSGVEAPDWRPRHDEAYHQA